MKLSRRGKSVRRRRHTKRTGKHLRYRGKKVRASKRYRRGIGDRGHTKKTHRKIYRGRVKKGGVDEKHWEKVQWTNVVKDNPSKKQATGKLVYKKDSTFSLTSESKYFRVILETQSGLIEVTDHPPYPPYPPYNYMKFKVTMERYKDDDKIEVDKIFTVYFDFGYIPPSEALNNRLGKLDLWANNPDKIRWFLFQTTEDGKRIEQKDIRVLADITRRDNISVNFVSHYEMPALVDTKTNSVSFNFPEKFSNITGYDKSNKSKSDNYIFYGTTIGLLINGPDDDKSNTAFFNSLATEMYRKVKRVALDAAEAAVNAAIALYESKHTVPTDDKARTPATVASSSSTLTAE